MRLPGGVLSRRLTRSPNLTAALFFSLFYCVAILFVWHISWRDPGSWFFNADSAYEPKYSSVRLQQAEEYLTAASDDSFGRRGRHQWKEPQLCVGLVSVARDGVQYLRTAVASLHEGLTVEERDAIHLIVFIPHVDPSVHPAYHDQSIVNLTDQLLLYNLTGDALDKVKELEQTKHARAKGMLDYQYLMNACYESGAPYLALLEDDILAMDGWFHRTMRGLKEAEQKATAENRVRHEGDFLYLRLFYTEEFFGWNFEELPLQASYCTVFIILVAACLLFARRRFVAMERYITHSTIAMICCIYLPLLVLLYYSTGKVTTSPLPSGVNAMNNYGCCAQGLVWPRQKAKELMDWYNDDHPYGFGDSLIEEYANRRGEMRYALTPSVLQHIGSTSSRGDDWGPQSKHNRPVAQKLWNFAFEMNDAETLRKEHEEVVETAWPT